MTDEPVAYGPFLIRSSVDLYESPWLTLREDEVIRPGGSDGRFAIVTMRPGATVVAVDDDHVLLAREFKYAVARETLELVSGGLDVGESPLDGARRELEEEAGVTGRTWTNLGVVDPFTTSIHSPNHMFLAQGLEATEVNPDDGEVVAIERIPFDEVVEMVMSGRITHGASCVALLKAARHLGR